MERCNLNDPLPMRVLKYFSDRQGKRITNKTVAAMFDLKMEDSRKLLNTLVAQGKLLHEFNPSGHGRQYYMPLPHEAIKKHVTVNGGMKPYVPGPEWETVYERLADFRAIKSIV